MNTNTFAVQLAGNFDIPTAIWTGVTGAAAMLVVIYAGRATGMTSMDLLRTLGTMINPTGSAGAVYATGLMIHLMMGAAFGLVHAGLIHAADPSTTGAATLLGIAFGAAHGVIVTAMMPPMLTMAHPLVRTHEMPAPRTMMTGFGTMTPAGMVMAHIVFGLVAGGLYVAVAS